ncbi:MAG: VWA domain-containing protein, partial [Candidatus Adiutrix sp.]|nr:VWA domain-containing protein [Candidatus Adiutrix sp.]
MQQMVMISRAFFAALVGLLIILAGPAAAQAPRTPLMVEGKSALPLRVLTRPMSNLYQKAEENSPVVQGNLPAFSNFYVYAKPGGEEAAAGLGWYEVGRDDQGGVVGWLRTDDVFEWRQTMCLAYTNPSGREPVLMFENRRPLEDLIKKSPPERTAGAKALYETIESKNFPADFPVVSVEPKLAVDIAKQFYLLPILDFQVIEMDGREGRLLELAAATAGGPAAREKSDIRTNSDYLTAASLTADDAARKDGGNLAVDIVWVIDTTVSMSPYIARTLQVVRDVSERLAARPDLSQKVRFGVWGYRDPVEDIPAIEYTTKNYTPELQSVTDFVTTMGQVQETKVDSVDFPEDVFSGLNDALYQTAWRPDSLKIMVLVGDAPGHELGHKWNLTGLDAEKFKALAGDKKVTLMAVQVRPNGGKR